MACSEVVLNAVTELTVMPVPKLAVLQLGVQPAVAKCVNAPVMVTVDWVRPWAPLVGTTASISG